MRVALALATAVALLSGCATPVTMLTNESTGQVARCGGGAAGSIAGGLIGYTIEKSSDEQCVRDYEARGFRQAGVAAASPTAAPSPAQPPAQLPREAVTKAPPPPQGQYGFTAAKFAREQRCAAFDTPAQFVAKGPGYESYSVACTNGDVMMVRCEFGTCRALR